MARYLYNSETGDFFRLSPHHDQWGRSTLTPDYDPNQLPPSSVSVIEAKNAAEARFRLGLPRGYLLGTGAMNKRLQDIVHLATVENASLASLAAPYNISLQRVSQLLRRVGLSRYQRERHAPTRPSAAQ